MAKYKVVKDARYDFIYSIYKQVFTYWYGVGFISVVSKEDEDIISKAKEKITPKTIYFDA